MGALVKTEVVFRLEKEPNVYGNIFSQNCKIEIERTGGTIYLNYENRHDSVVGSFENLRIDNEVVLADIILFDESLKIKEIQDRIEYAIEGGIVKRSESGEVEHFKIKRVAVLMHNKF